MSQGSYEEQAVQDGCQRRTARKCNGHGHLSTGEQSCWVEHSCSVCTSAQSAEQLFLAVQMMQLPVPTPALPNQAQGLFPSAQLVVHSSPVKGRNQPLLPEEGGEKFSLSWLPKQGG